MSALIKVSQRTMLSQRTAVERAWASYTIAIAILETLAPGSPLYSIYPCEYRTWMDHRCRNRNALARMARVSRTLSGVALDVLWRYVDNIFHLIDVVPSCYMYEPMHERPGSQRRLQNIVSLFTIVDESTSQTELLTITRVRLLETHSDPR